MSRKRSEIFSRSFDFTEIKKLKGVSFAPAFAKDGTEQKDYVRLYCKRKDFAVVLNTLYPETFPLTTPNTDAAHLYVWIKYLNK